VKRLIAVAFLASILLAGCSGGGTLLSPAPESPSAARTGHFIMGFWQGIIDPAAQTIEFINLRSGNFHLNAIVFLEPPPLVNLTLETLKFNGNIIETDIGLRHPFLGLTEFTGFDVCGIFITNGSVTGFSDPDLRMAGAGDTRLLNPDGCSRWWNPAEFPHGNTMSSYKDGLLGTPDSTADYNSTLNAYKYFCDDLDAGEALNGITLENRGMFSAGTKNIRHYTIQLGTAGLIFNYAVDASWVFPSGQPPWKAPDDFPPAANRPEAYRVSVLELENTLYYVNNSIKGGNLSLLIDVYDWSDPGLNNVKMECPSVFAAVSSATPIGGGEGYSTYQLDITDATPHSAGAADVLISVIDPVTGYQELLPGKNVTGYFIHKAAVSNNAPTPATVLSINPNWGWLDEKYTDVTIAGSDFVNGCEVKLEYVPGDVIDGTNVTWIDSTKLECDLDLTGATLGKYDVQVINPGIAAGVLPDGFEVKKKAVMWPVTQGNPGHTGYVGLSGPSGVLSSPKWTSEYVSGLGNSLSVFLSTDTAFFCETGNTLNPLPAAAVNLADGKTKWIKYLHNAAGDWTNVRGLSADATIVVVNESSHSLIAGLDAGTGDVKWQMSGSIAADAYTTNDNDGNIIIPVSSVGYISLKPQTGAVNWTASIGDPFYCAAAVGPDGTIYGQENGITNARIHALNPATGADKWSSFPAIGRSTNTLTVTSDGKIIAFGENGLYCFTDNGTAASQLWFQSYPMIWYGSVAVAPNGDIYLFDINGTLRRLNPDTGATINSSTGWGDGYGSRPAIGNDGLIYVNNWYNFRCFNPDCTQKWTYSGPFGGYFAAPAIGLNGWVYAPKRQLGLYAWHD
jgi:hypothetical protein